MAGKTVHVEVTLEECGGDFNKMLKKFNRKLFRSNILQEAKERGFFVKPSQIRHNKKRCNSRKK